MDVAPFRLKPWFSERVWGKRDLRPWYADTGTTELVGEAWLTGPQCVVETGPFAGWTLASVAAEPGAVIALGLKDGVGVDDVKTAVSNGTMEELMEWVPVSVGDMLFVDAGTVHAIGQG